MSEQSWKYVIDHGTGGFHPDLNKGEVYDFRRRGEEKIYSFRMSEQSPYLNIAGLEWRKRQ